MNKARWGKDKLDVEDRISDSVKISQRSSSRDIVVGNVDGLGFARSVDEDLYIADRLEAKFKGSLDWIEKLIPHKPSIGFFYESIVKDCVRELSPNLYSVDSGFVYDEFSEKSSPQLDIIVSKAGVGAKLYSGDGFCVVKSKNVISTSEIKKSLKVSEIRNLISKLSMLDLSGVGENGVVSRYNVFSIKKNIKIDTLIDTVFHGFDDISRGFNSKTVSGDSVEFFAFRISVPNFFFFESDEYVRFDLEFDNDGGAVLIGRVYRNFDRSGLNRFLDATFPDLLVADPFSEPNYLVPVFENIDHEIRHKINIPIRRKFNTSQISEKIFDFKEYSERELADGNCIFGAVVDPRFDLDSIQSVEELVKSPGFFWLRR